MKKEREVRFSEKLLLAGFSFILLFMLVHDWVPLGTLNDVQAVAQENSFQELIIVTLIGSVQFLLLIGLVLLFIGKKYPIWVKLWLVIHQVFIFIGVLIDWWIPYFFGIGAEKRVETYNQMFGNTHTFLPTMNGIAPNTLHIVFHSVLFGCILLTIYIFISDARKRKESANLSL